MTKQTYTIIKTENMVVYRDEGGAIVATALPGSDMMAFIANGISETGNGLRDESGQYLIGTLAELLGEHA